MNTPSKIINLKNPLAVMDGIDPVAAEQYRIFYTKIEQINHMHSYKSFAITSAITGEGKSTTALNIAFLMANEFNKKVVIVGGDLRNPSLPGYFLGIQNKYDLSHVLKEEVNVEEAILRIEESKLYILPTIKKISASSRLLGLPGMKKLMDTLKTKFDYIIFDSPPILSIADMNLISKIVDGIVLVIMANKTPRRVIKQAVESMDTRNIVGIILNGTNSMLMKYRYNASYYY